MSRMCWARAVSACSTKLSGEHYLSKGLFSDAVTIRGFPWCKDKPKTVGINSLTANVLCQTHNSALSPLDAEASHAWKTLQLFMERVDEVRLLERLRLGPPHRKKLHVAIDGALLERWTFKVMAGLVASGMVEGFPENWQPTAALARFIFGEQALPAGCGLGFVVKIGERVDDWDHISFNLIRGLGKRRDHAEGFLMEFRGLRLAGSSTAPLASLHTPVDFANPEMVLLHFKRFEFPLIGKLDFRWPRHASGPNAR
jgi:hypothetical protein